ncbi:MAG: DUF359 domain-containing protein, partial [Candidatus Nanohaloarchaea archaeon]
MFYTVSDRDREKLRKPRGEVVHGREELARKVENRGYHRLVSVGDRVTEHLSEEGLDPDICIVDGKVRRKEIDRDV